MTHADPSTTSRSTVEMGATTTKGTPCRAASTAALYVPILFAVSPFAAMRSAPTTAQVASQSLEKNNQNEDQIERTDGIDFVVLEKRSDHCVTNHA
jgi:hypothetical protein